MKKLKLLKNNILRYILKDEKILTMFQINPKEALGILFDKYFEYLSKETYFVLRNKGETEDVIQDLFVDLWQKPNLLLNINSSLKYYLKRAAINRSINIIKKRIHIDDFIDDVNGLEGNVKQPNLLEVDELANRIHSTIDLLPPKCRMIFVLSRFENKSYKEISTDLGISIKTVENQISKALKILREKILF